MVVVDLLPLLRHVHPTHHDIHRAYHHMAFSLDHADRRQVHVSKFREIINFLLSRQTHTELPVYRLVCHDSKDWAYCRYTVDELEAEADLFREVPPYMWSILVGPEDFDSHAPFHVRVLPAELRTVLLTIQIQAPAEIVTRRELRRLRRNHLYRP